MHLELAAHVDHGVAHTSEVAKISLGIGAAVIAVAIVASGGAVAVALVGASQAGTVLGAVGAASLAGSLGMDVGGLIGKYFLDKPIVEHIKKGIDSVLLGPNKKEAARAHATTTLTSHTYVVEGSLVTMLGKEYAPMSRRQDRTECGGEIAQGIDTIFVGGTPSKHGQGIPETESGWASFLRNTLSVMGVVSAAREGAAKAFVAGVPLALGAVNEDAGTAATALSSLNALRSPAGALERLGQVIDVSRGGALAVPTP